MLPADMSPRRKRHAVITGALLAMLTVLVLAVSAERSGNGTRLPEKGSTPTPSAGASPPEGATSSAWVDGQVHGRWTVRYAGYGEVSGSDDDVVLQPASAATPDITHGALVHTTAECLDADFAVTVRTESQVRDGEPNPWEVGWVLWNFHHDTRFYAVVLKPNGWEISKQHPDYPGNQNFLTSGSEPRFPLGGEYRVTVTQDWPRMTVSVDGEELATVIDRDGPYRGGAVGLYTEDARVRFNDFDLPQCLEN